jgi:hypothetical protein
MQSLFYFGIITSEAPRAISNVPAHSRQLTASPRKKTQKNATNSADEQAIG